MQQFITDRLPEIQELCRTHHVQRMTVFGSAVRDDFDPETSDVDVRVEFLPGTKPKHSWGQLELKDSLAALFRRDVDLLYVPIRNTYLKREIEDSEVLLYGVMSVSTFRRCRSSFGNSRASLSANPWKNFFMTSSCNVQWKETTRLSQPFCAG